MRNIRNTQKTAFLKTLLVVQKFLFETKSILKIFQKYQFCHQTSIILSCSWPWRIFTSCKEQLSIIDVSWQNWYFMILRCPRKLRNRRVKKYQFSLQHEFKFSTSSHFIRRLLTKKKLYIIILIINENRQCASLLTRYHPTQGT